jgi:hypothetical protein
MSEALGPRLQQRWNPEVEPRAEAVSEGLPGKGTEILRRLSRGSQEVA